jgi:hypothetical protein
MTERDLHHQDQAPPQEPWDIQGMAEALRAETEIVDDLYHGQGVLFRIGLSRSKLAAWEQHNYIEATTEVIQVRMADVGRPGIDDSGVIFYSRERPGQAVWIDHLGTITAHSAGLSPAPEHLYPEPTGSLPTHQPVLDAAPNAPVTAKQAGQQDAADSTPVEQREQSNRVEIIGRVGWEPKYREFQSGNARLQFSISQQLEDGSTRWHTVKAFKERARKYRDTVHKGDAVHLVGGRATEKYNDKSGQEREREFVILWGLKPFGREGRHEPQ